MAAETPEPHEFDEDPEENLGAEIPDPWSDPDQLDWPSDDEEAED